MASYKHFFTLNARRTALIFSVRVIMSYSRYGGISRMQCGPCLVGCHFLGRSLKQSLLIYIYSHFIFLKLQILSEILR